MTIVFTESAFYHGFTAEDIHHVMTYPLVDRLMDKHINKYLVLGFNPKGNLLEIMYNLVDAEIANVFHVMKCRKGYYKYLPRR